MQIRLREFLYLSNLLSLARFILIIPFYYLLKFNPAPANIILIFLTIIIILTDFLDGYVSRKKNQVTDLGKLLDPLADKAAMAIGLIGLVLYRNFPLPLVILLIYRDLMILIIGWFGLNRLGKPIMANIYGKINTTVISLTVLFYLLGITGTLLTIFLGASYISIIISGISYEMVGEKILALQGKTLFLFRILIILISVIILFFIRELALI
jgi:CDP-diacylglycerol--glycerol-3-phosphate 3-phosphatidyltransferase